MSRYSSRRNEVLDKFLRLTIINIVSREEVEKPMFWLIGIYYTAVLGFIFLAYSISYDEPVVFGAVVFLLVLLCAIPAVIFFNQKKEHKKDIEFVKNQLWRL